MRRCICVFVVLALMLALAVPVFAADLQGGYYFVADCALGSGVKFYVPADYIDGCLTYDGSGDLFNLTTSSVYLYAPDYSGYTIYAPRFSGFQYRAGTGYGEYSDLAITAITETNIRILSEDPGRSIGHDQLLLIIVVLLVLLIGYLVVHVRR